MTKTKPAKDCATMKELRQQIDALDTDLIALLARRTTYIDRAIDLKQIENLPARAVDRVEEVVANVRRTAEGHALDPELAEKLWREIIEWSIARESKVLDH